MMDDDDVDDDVDDDAGATCHLEQEGNREHNDQGPAYRIACHNKRLAPIRLTCRGGGGNEPNNNDGPLLETNEGEHVTAEFPADDNRSRAPAPDQAALDVYAFRTAFDDVQEDAKQYSCVVDSSDERRIVRLRALAQVLGFTQPSIVDLAALAAVMEHDHMHGHTGDHLRERLRPDQDMLQEFIRFRNSTEDSYNRMRVHLDKHLSETSLSYRRDQYPPLKHARVMPPCSAAASSSGAATSANTPMPPLQYELRAGEGLTEMSQRVVADYKQRVNTSVGRTGGRWQAETSAGYPKLPPVPAQPPQRALSHPLMIVPSDGRSEEPPTCKNIYCPETVQWSAEHSNYFEYCSLTCQLGRGPCPPSETKLEPPLCRYATVDTPLGKRTYQLSGGPADIPSGISFKLYDAPNDPDLRAQGQEVSQLLQHMAGRGIGTDEDVYARIVGFAGPPPTSDSVARRRWVCSQPMGGTHVIQHIRTATFATISTVELRGLLKTQGIHPDKPTPMRLREPLPPLTVPNSAHPHQLFDDDSNPLTISRTPMNDPPMPSSHAAWKSMQGPTLREECEADERGHLDGSNDAKHGRLQPVGSTPFKVLLDPQHEMDRAQVVLVYGYGADDMARAIVIVWHDHSKLPALGPDDGREQDALQCRRERSHGTPYEVVGKCAQDHVDERGAHTGLHVVREAYTPCNFAFAMPSSVVRELLVKQEWRPMSIQGMWRCTPELLPPPDAPPSLPPSPPTSRPPTPPPDYAAAGAVDPNQPANPAFAAPPVAATPTYRPPKVLPPSLRQTHPPTRSAATYPTDSPGGGENRTHKIDETKEDESGGGTGGPSDEPTKRERFGAEPTEVVIAAAHSSAAARPASAPTDDATPAHALLPGRKELSLKLDQLTDLFRARFSNGPAQPKTMTSGREWTHSPPKVPAIRPIDYATPGDNQVGMPDRTRAAESSGSGDRDRPPDDEQSFRSQPQMPRPDEEYIPRATRQSFAIRPARNEDGGQDRTLLILTVCVEGRSPEECRSADILGTGPFVSLPYAHGTQHMTNAVLSMPMPLWRTVEGAIESYLNTNTIGVSDIVVDDIELPIYLDIDGRDNLCSIVRVNFMFDHPVSTTVVAADLTSNVQFSDILHIEELSQTISLKEVRVAAHAASAIADDEGRAELFHLLTALSTICRRAPRALYKLNHQEPNGRHRSPDSYANRDDSHPYRSRRARWRDGPVNDLLEFFPVWDHAATTISEYQITFVRALHTENASRIPELLKEERPFDTIMQVSVQAHCRNDHCALTLRDAGVAVQLRQLLSAVDDTTRDLFLAAAQEPRDRTNQRSVADAVREGNKCIRAVYLRTNPMSLLQTEADNLLRWVTTIAITSQLDYVCDVDNRVSFSFDLWGARDTARLISLGSSLTRVLPAFVGRLGPTLQDCALAYFNSIVHAYEKLPESARPPTLQKALQRLKDRQVFGRIEQPNHELWLAFEDNNKILDRDHQGSNQRHRRSRVHPRPECQAPHRAR